MNLAYYVVLFDNATAAIYNMMGVGHAYRLATRRSPFVAETHTLYERELKAGERVRITSRLIGVDTKRLHYFHQMFHAEQGHRVAAQELVAIHVDHQIRRSIPFAPDLLRHLQQIVAAENARPLPAGIGRTISLSKKAC